MSETAESACAIDEREAKRQGRWAAALDAAVGQALVDLGLDDSLARRRLTGDENRNIARRARALLGWQVVTGAQTTSSIARIRKARGIVLADKRSVPL